MKNFKTASRTILNIDQNSFNSGTINISANTDIVITEDITIDSVNEYLDLQDDNITIDGQGYTITVTVADYPGFIKNGDDNTTATAPCKNLEIKNINVAVSGSGSLASNGGWIGQDRFGIGINEGNILFENCSSSGDIEYQGGGISGRYTGHLMTSSTITFNNCYSTGAIRVDAGGISGRTAGEGMSNSTIEFNNCYSTGAIGGVAGGISGYDTGYEMSNSTIEFNNCYSTGGISSDAGGISGEYTGELMNSSTITANNCYTIGSIGTRAGGIYGYRTGNSMSNSTITANNCYTIGSIGTNAGGIYGYDPHTNATHSKCIYFNDKSDDITVPVAQIANTWEDTNAARTIGTTTANNDITNIWHNPDASSAWVHRTSGQTSINGGCTDTSAFNYDSNADIDNGNCKYSISRQIIFVITQHQSDNSWSVDEINLTINNRKTSHNINLTGSTTIVLNNLFFGKNIIKLANKGHVQYVSTGNSTWDLFEIEVIDIQGCNIDIENLTEDSSLRNSDHPLSNLVDNNKGTFWSYDPNYLNLNTNASGSVEDLQWLEFEINISEPKTVISNSLLNDQFKFYIYDGNNVKKYIKMNKTNNELYVNDSSDNSNDIVPLFRAHLTSCFKYFELVNPLYISSKICRFSDYLRLSETLNIPKNQLYENDNQIKVKDYDTQIISYPVNHKFSDGSVSLNTYSIYKEFDSVYNTKYNTVYDNVFFNFDDKYETKDALVWINSLNGINSDFNWTRNQGVTSSIDTGPTGDALTLNEGYYLYLKATDNYNKTAELIGKFQLISKTSMKFRYHMLIGEWSEGATLKVLYKYEGETEWTQSSFDKLNNQGNIWHDGEVIFEPGNIEIKFEGKTGRSFKSDILIDSISLERISSGIKLQNTITIYKDVDTYFTPNINDIIDNITHDDPNFDLSNIKLYEHILIENDFNNPLSDQVMYREFSEINQITSRPQEFKLSIFDGNNYSTRYKLKYEWNKMNKIIKVTDSNEYNFDDNYDSVDIYVWVNSENDDINWIRNQGGTSSTNTGPTGDALTLNDGYYLYMEASGYNNKTAELIGKFQLISKTSMKFRYHMLIGEGSEGATLKVLYKYEGETEWTQSSFDKLNDQGNIWHDAEVIFEPGNIEIKFEGKTGRSFRSDILIDSISLTSLGCGDPDACNYNEPGDCKYLDCAGICGGNAKILNDHCIIDKEISGNLAYSNESDVHIPDCEFYDCAGTCGGLAKIVDNYCIVEYKM